MAEAIKRKRLLLQGATGSIGESVVSVVREHPERFRVVGIAAAKNMDQLIKLANVLEVESIALADESKQGVLREFAESKGINQVYAGENAVRRQAEECSYDLLVNALVGNAGMEPTLSSLNRGIPVALANKETLVAAGPFVLEASQKNNAPIIPIDSEHSAIFQCLMGEERRNVRAIWLTTSGGPFWEQRHSDLSHVTVEQALGHPTWRMGEKITIDSATLFNKGLEVIEAARLFDISPENIRVVAHRQSVVHSMVEFTDGSIKAQLGRPDMRLPVLFALSYPDRFESKLCATGVSDLNPLTFEQVKAEDFPCLELAYDALRRGGTALAALSAADEIAVAGFLGRAIRFTDIAEVIKAVMENWPDETPNSIHDIRQADGRARDRAKKRIDNMKSRCGVLQ